MYKIAPDQHSFTKDINTCLAEPVKSLWCNGTLPEQRQPAVAIVGTRKPTTYGKEVTARLAGELAAQGVVIISGLALGIDGIAHEAALEAGGITIAVLPTSLEQIYPYIHRSLAKRIVERGGALLSEYNPGDQVYKSNFLARNRIVSALADGLLITEAAQHSGTTTTAAFALEQGKPVMAIPGNITSPLSVGCNQLLQRGARLITCCNEVLEEIGCVLPATPAVPAAQTPEQQAILMLIASGLRDGDQLLLQSQLTPSLFSQTITLLELQGKVRPLGANQWGS